MYTGIPGASAIAGPHPAAQQLLRLRGGVALAQRGLEARRALLRLQARSRAAARSAASCALRSATPIRPCASARRSLASLQVHSLG